MFIPNLLSAESGSESIVQARIVVVEDEPDLRDAVAEYLSANGYDVATAASAAEARGLLNTQSFHLAILDIAMPGEDGLSLGRWLRTTRSAAFLVHRIWLSKFLNRMSDGLERDQRRLRSRQINACNFRSLGSLMSCNGRVWPLLGWLGYNVYA